MPQFDFTNVFWPQIFWLAVIFIALYFGVVRWTLPKLGKVMETREAKVADDLAAAKLSKDQADSLAVELGATQVEARENARSVVAEAKAKSAAAIAKKLAAADAKTDAALAEAQSRIEAARDKALGDIEAVVAENAQAIVQKLTGSTVAVAEAKQAAKAAVAG
jgi:F-type H+-transporting ATPase subunit b